jgi:hypothetical protein
MPEDDFLIPRGSHSPAPEAQPCEPVRGLRIDPKILEERRLRKERLLPHPKTVDGEKDEQWRYLDRRIGEDCSGFDNRMWMLGDTARWIADGTREAVNGLTIDEQRLFQILPEIQEALAAGEIRAWAHTPNDPVPRELPSETWEIYDLVVEERDSLLWIFPLRSNASPHEQVLRDIRLSRDDVLRRWPADQENTPSPEVGTVGAEHGCRLWLTKLMKADSDRPRPKHALRKEAEDRFPRLSKRGFDRAWDSAVRESGARKWSAPGRRS